MHLNSEGALPTVATELRHSRTHVQGTSWEERTNTSYLVQGKAARSHRDIQSSGTWAPKDASVTGTFIQAAPWVNPSSPHRKKKSKNTMKRIHYPRKSHKMNLLLSDNEGVIHELSRIDYHKYWFWMSWRLQDHQNACVLHTTHTYHTIPLVHAHAHTRKTP